MKICKRCGEVNEDENLLCKNGDCLNKEFEDYGYFYYIFSRRFNCRYNKL